MLIYVETKAKPFPFTQRILGKFPWAQVLEIDHYKNIFDKNIGNQRLAPAIILATQDHIPILPVPENYGRPGKSFFFKTSLNCVFDCEYCYLKANFKTQHSVIFVNYDEIKEKIKNQILSYLSQRVGWSTLTIVRLLGDTNEPCLFILSWYFSLQMIFFCLIFARKNSS